MEFSRFITNIIFSIIFWGMFIFLVFSTILSPFTENQFVFYASVLGAIIVGIMAFYLWKYKPIFHVKKSRPIFIAIFIIILLFVMFILYLQDVNIFPSITEPSSSNQNSGKLTEPVSDTTNNDNYKPVVDNTPTVLPKEKPWWEYFELKNMTNVDCNRFNYEGYSSFGGCLGERAVFTKNSSWCWDISSNVWSSFVLRNQCFVQLAVITDDIFLCDLVSDTNPNLFQERSLDYKNKCIEFFVS